MPRQRVSSTETPNGPLHLRSVHGRTAPEHALAVLVLPLVLLAVLDPAQPWATATVAALALVWLGIAFGLVLRVRRGAGEGAAPGRVGSRSGGAAGSGGATRRRREPRVGAGPHRPAPPPASSASSATSL